MSDYIVYLNAFPSIQSDFDAIAKLMACLMMRNVATSGWIFQDPSGRLSKPGCIIASPSFPADDPDTDQNYIYNWTRDAAITATEFVPLQKSANFQEYVTFAKLTQDAATSANKPIGWACFCVNGPPRDWSEQSDGPALQILAILFGWSLLGPVADTARSVIKANLSYLLDKYQKPTRNLWEETDGYSFFARAVQLKCFRELLDRQSEFDFVVQQKTAISTACDNLKALLPNHWNASAKRYISILSGGSQGADINADVVMACVYGAVDCTDSKLLSTAAQIRDTFANPNSPWFYQINAQDNALGMGPLIGRYPGDVYDGSIGNGETPGGHPWAPCTCNFAELYYRLAHAIHQSGTLSIDGLTAPFFAQINIGQSTPTNAAVELLKAAGDRMLRAVMRHSDHVELSEQFNGNNGFEMSVHNLTWSYAAFISAVRARNSV